MPTIALRRFTNPDTLKHIGERFLIELLAPHTAFLAGRGLTLSASTEAGRIDYERLASIFMTLDMDMPNDLVDALFNIHELCTTEGMDKLQEAVERRHLELDLDGEAEPADVAVRVWLRHRKVFEEVQIEHHLTRPKSFLSYLTDREPLPAFTVPDRKVLAELEAHMDVWFEQKRRGRGCRVFAYPRDGECWFLVRHGEPFRREGSLVAEGEPSSVFYRPQQHDILVYYAGRGELRVHAGTSGERKLYRKYFGLCLFGDEKFFLGVGKYTLAPLARDGSASMNCRDVDGIEWVRLKEIEIQWGKGVNAEVEIRKAADLFAAFESRGYRLQAGDDLKRAVFSVKFADTKMPRSVTITPSNRAKYERDEDSTHLEAWLTKRGFIRQKPEEEEEAGES